MLYRFNYFFESLPERLHPWRWWIIFLYLILLSFLAIGIPRFAFTWANDDMFGKNDPVQISIDRIKELYGGTVSLLMVYRPVDGDILSNRSLIALKNVQNYFENESAKAENDPKNPLSLITSVESILNASYTDTLGDNIIFRDFINEELPLRPGKNKFYWEKAIKEPEYNRVLFSENKEFGALLFRTNLDAIPIEIDQDKILNDEFLETEIIPSSEEEILFV